MTKELLIESITAYLSGGGLFNPELADHDAVRDLLIECRAALAAPPSDTMSAEEVREACAEVMMSGVYEGRLNALDPSTVGGKGKV